MDCYYLSFVLFFLCCCLIFSSLFFFVVVFFFQPSCIVNLQSFFFLCVVFRSSILFTHHRDPAGLESPPAAAVPPHVNDSQHPSPKTQAFLSDISAKSAALALAFFVIASPIQIFLFLLNIIFPSSPPPREEKIAALEAQLESMKFKDLAKDLVTVCCKCASKDVQNTTKDDYLTILYSCITILGNSRSSKSLN